MKINVNKVESNKEAWSGDFLYNKDRDILYFVVSDKECDSYMVIDVKEHIVVDSDLSPSQLNKYYSNCILIKYDDVEINIKYQEE